MKSSIHTNALLKLCKSKGIIQPLDLEKAGTPEKNNLRSNSLEETVDIIRKFLVPALKINA